jgi:AraC-like DNA-binding protein
MESSGAPVDRYQNEVGLPSIIKSAPDSWISYQKSIRLLEITACRESSLDFGFQTGLNISIKDLGLYGQIINRAVTIYDYLRLAISMYEAISNAESFHLEDCGNFVRLHHKTIFEPNLGTLQSDLQGIALTVQKFRQALGEQWTPQRISLAYASREAVKHLGRLGYANVICGTGETYIELTREELGAKFPGRNESSADADTLTIDDLEVIPDGLSDILQGQIKKLLPTGELKIELLAECLGVPSRTLQRQLSRSGLTYSQLLSETRYHIAVDWLDAGDRTITEIGQELGYSNSENFTRAFRAKSGLAPSKFLESPTNHLS